MQIRIFISKSYETVHQNYPSKTKIRTSTSKDTLKFVSTYKFLKNIQLNFRNNSLLLLKKPEDLNSIYHQKLKQNLNILI